MSGACRHWWLVVSLVLLQIACVSGTRAPADAGSDTAVDGGDGVRGEEQALGCTLEHELPIVTHWNDTARSFEYGASDPIDVRLGYSQEPYQPGRCYPVWQLDDVFYPDVNDYVGMNSSIYTVDEDQVRSLTTSLCEETGVPVKFLRPPATPGDLVDLDRLVSNPGYVQVVHGSLVKIDDGDPGSMATIVLPPNWSREAPAGTYPIVANGYYDLNLNIFNSWVGELLIRMVSLSSAQGGSGAIGVQWNGGGGEASYTLNERAFRQFAKLIDSVAIVLGGDRDRLLMFGGSRGGNTALLMASNPWSDEYGGYRTRFIGAVAAVGSFACLAEVGVSMTYAKMFDNLGDVTGHHDAWRTGWTYPACAGKPHLTGTAAREAMFNILAAADPEELDAIAGPIADSYIQRLADHGTRLVLDIGTHDKLPYRCQVEYARKLVERGIEAEVLVSMRAGHGGARTAFQKILEALSAFAQGRELEVTPGVSFVRVDRASGSHVPFSPEDGMFPFTMDAPYLVAPGQRVPLVLVGHPGTAYEIGIHPPAGDPGTALTVTGSIPDRADHVISSVEWLDIPVDLTPGEYAYSLRIRKPGACADCWKTIPNTNTPAGAGEKAVLQVMPEEPNLAGRELADLYFQQLPQLSGSEGKTCWGLAEY